MRSRALRGLPDGRGIYHPRQACAWCGQRPSEDHDARRDPDHQDDRLLELCPNLSTQLVALRCRDRLDCIRRQYKRKVLDRDRILGVAS